MAGLMGMVYIWVWKEFRGEVERDLVLGIIVEGEWCEESFLEGVDVGILGRVGDI